MISAQSQVLAATAVFVVNLVWMGLRGRTIWDRYVGPGRPGRSALLWATALIGAATIYLGAPAALGMVGGWGWSTSSTLVEVTTSQAEGGLAYAVFSGPSMGALLPAGVCLTTLGWFAILIDSRTQMLPDRLTALMAVEIILLALTGPLIADTDPHWYLVVLTAAVLWLLPVLLGNRLGQVGMGDVKIAPVLGATLGTCSFKVAALGLAGAFVAAGLRSLFHLSHPKWRNRARPGGQSVRRFAFGPYLVGAAIASWTLVAVGMALTVAS